MVAAAPPLISPTGGGTGFIPLVGSVLSLILRLGGVVLDVAYGISWGGPAKSRNSYPAVQGPLFCDHVDPGRLRAFPTDCFGSEKEEATTLDLRIFHAYCFWRFLSSKSQPQFLQIRVFGLANKGSKPGQ